jgi:hypothetical protein
MDTIAHQMKILDFSHDINKCDALLVSASEYKGTIINVDYMVCSHMLFEVWGAIVVLSELYIIAQLTSTLCVAAY